MISPNYQTMMEGPTLRIVTTRLISTAGLMGPRILPNPKKNSATSSTHNQPIPATNGAKTRVRNSRKHKKAKVWDATNKDAPEQLSDK